MAEISVGAVVPQQGHSHEENEVYFILEGQGTLHGPSEKTRVAKGEAIYIPGGTEHHITNTGKETLRRSISLIQAHLLMLNTTKNHLIKNKEQTHNPCG